ncbi:hypothetical protein ETD83_10850 [Actinomadura soli]|uniref:Uncharacterized protein n=1 Tax=Actinomadura soli TaxID=2508997 RepID=A0A5C4JFA3_9ACTN|nr:hypothetical protein [Actinomadura soli]TMR03396.1 hypothetical protein ETD83_10850 [Actinomadura soli]
MTTTPPPAGHPRRPQREHRAAAPSINHPARRPTRLDFDALRVILAGVSLVGIAFVLFAIISPSASGLEPRDDAEIDLPAWQGALVAAGVVAFAGLIAFGILLASRADRATADRARQSLQQAEHELAAADQLALPALWEVTQKRLDYYHQIATSQARTSFRNAQAAMVIGFVLLAVFATMAATADSTAAAAVTGALGAVAAALAGFISRTFVRSQDTSASHLRSYFDQPLEFSRYLAAERLLNSVQQLNEEQRAAILADLLRTVIAPTAPPRPVPRPPRPPSPSTCRPARPPRPAREVPDDVVRRVRRRSRR